MNQPQRRIELPVVDPHEAFLQAIRAQPDDDGPRQMYADWLEEQGDVRGEYLRLLGQLEAKPKSPERRELRARLRVMRKGIDRAWLAAVVRPEIERCKVQFEFECPKRWDRLTLTDDPSVRFCEACRKPVYYSQTVAEARRHAARGRCGAVDLVPVRRARDLSPPRRRPWRILMGRILPNRLRPR